MDGSFQKHFLRPSLLDWAPCDHSIEVEVAEEQVVLSCICMGHIRYRRHSQSLSYFEVGLVLLVGCLAAEVLLCLLAQAAVEAVEELLKERDSRMVEVEKVPMVSEDSPYLQKSFLKACGLSEEALAASFRSEAEVSVYFVLKSQG